MAYQYFRLRSQHMICTSFIWLSFGFLCRANWLHAKNLAEASVLHQQLQRTVVQILPGANFSGGAALERPRQITAAVLRKAILAGWADQVCTRSLLSSCHDSLNPSLPRRNQKNCSQRVSAKIEYASLL